MIGRALIAIAVLVWPTVAACASPLPEGWVVYPTPKPKACEWSRANYSKREWRVRLEGGKLVIEPTSVRPRHLPDLPMFDIPASPMRRMGEPPCDGCVLRVADGWLVGYNFGEFGGGLWQTDRNGNNAAPVMNEGRCKDIADTGPAYWNEKPGERFQPYQISNIVNLSARGERVFAFDGLAHLGISVGTLHRIERRDGKWQACTVRNLERSPDAVVADGDTSWLALLAGGLDLQDMNSPRGMRAGVFARVYVDGRMQELAKPAFLDTGLYPNSMVKFDDGTVFAGMRHFVARLTPDARGTYLEELLIPKDRPIFDYEPSFDDPNYPASGRNPNCPRPQ